MDIGDHSMNIDMIRAADARLQVHKRVTPLLSSPFIDEIAGRRVLIKAECLQHTGSFKFRGAFSAISALSAAQRAKGILAFSSGNHAQGVALAAKLHGVPSVIIMPKDAPAIKINNTRALGGEVILYDRDTEDRDALGEAMERDRGLTLVRPFDDPQVIAGQGTAGLEIAVQGADMGISDAQVLVCCGGGGLTSGIATALAADAPKMRVCPVEPVGFDDTARSLVAGTHQTNAQTSGSICDAIVTPSPGKLTFPILKDLCPRGYAVTDEQALMAIKLAFQRLKIVLEPGGAVALAAALFLGDALSHDTVIAVASGGNIDDDMFRRALEVRL
jgi:threonine dehydratase